MKLKKGDNMTETVPSSSYFPHLGLELHHLETVLPSERMYAAP